MSDETHLVQVISSWTRLIPWQCYREEISWWLKRKGKRWKKEYLYSVIYNACIVSKHSDINHSFTCKLHPELLAAILPFLRKRSPDGATPNWGSKHPVAAHYSSIDPMGMKGWVGLVGWPRADLWNGWVLSQYIVMKLV